MQPIFRALLLLAPAEFRARYGRELLADFRSSTREGLGFAACLDLLTTIVRERTSSAMRTISYTLRSLIRTPGVTIAMILTLAVGIAANVAAFAVINGVLLNPLPFPHSDRIMAVWRTTWINGVECRSCPHSLYNAFILRDDNTTFSSLAPYQAWDGIASTGDAPQHVNGARVGAQFIDVLGVRPALGRGFSLADERPGAPPVAMVSYAFWQSSLHANPSIVGRTILIDARPAHVIGVLPKTFFFPNFTRMVVEQPSVLLVLQHSTGLQPANNSMGMIGRLKAGVDPAAAQADLNRIIASLARKTPMRYFEGGHMDGIRVIPLAEDIFGSARALLFPIFGAVFIVLLIACLNVANLLIARAVGRRRDLAMRLALGASRRHVVGQIAAESFALSLLATVVGVVLARYAIAAYVALGPPGLHRTNDITIDARVVLYAAGIAILAAVVTSVLPVLASLRSNVFESLKDGRGRIGGRGTAARAALVSLQIACAFALVAGCGLLVRSLVAYTSANMGYPTANLIDVYGPPINAGLYPSPGAQQQYLRRLRANLAAVPGVRGVAFGTAVPLIGGGSDGTIDIAGGPKDADADFEFLSPGYFHVLGVPVVRGRAFSEHDNASSRAVAIVNQEFVKRFVQHDAPIGKTFSWGGTHYTIVGIVPDIALHYVGEPVRPAMYFAVMQLSSQGMSGDFIPWMVRTSVAPNASLTKAIADAWQSADPREPHASLYTAAQMVELSTSKTRANVFVLGALALIALLLAISGTASVVAYAVARRTNEIGVRMALGARRWRIVRALLGGAAAMLVVGLIVGLGLAAVAANSLAPQLYQTPPFDPQTYVAVAIILACATLAASFVPAYRAATIDPSTALRYE